MLQGCFLVFGFWVEGVSTGLDWNLVGTSGCSPIVKKENVMQKKCNYLDDIAALSLVLNVQANDVVST